MLSLPNFFTKPIQLRTSLYLFSLNSNSMAEEKHYHHHHVFHHNKDEDKPVETVYSETTTGYATTDGGYSESTTEGYGATAISTDDYRKEEKHHKHLEHLDELGAAAAGAYALVITIDRIYLLVFTMVRTPPPPLSLLTYLTI